MLHDLLHRFRAIMFRNKLETELDDELKFHLELQAEKHIKTGVRREEALRRARLELGGMDRYKEECREARGTSLFDVTIRDLRYAVRMLHKSRGFVVVAIATVAFGIAATTAVFNLVNTMLLDPPEFVQEPDRVFGLFLDDKATAEIDYRSVAYPQYDALMTRQNAADLAFQARAERAVTINGQTEVEIVYSVTGNYFSIYGVHATRGRTIEPEDYQAGAPFVGMISYDLWQRRFGGAEDIIGRTFELFDRPFTVVGVAPEGYVGTKLDWLGFPQVWIPLSVLKVLGPTPGQIYRTRGAYMPVTGRLKPGVSLEAAEAEMNVFAADMNDPTDSYHVDKIHLVPVASTRVDPVRRDGISNLLAALAVVSALVLLGSCFNVANFLLGQVATRKTEVAVRLALGASRARIIRQLLTEALLLACVASAVGLCLTVLMLRLVAYVPMLFGRISLYAGPVLDARTVAFMLGLTIICSLVFGLLPALAASAKNPWITIKQRTRGWTGGWWRLTPRQLVLAIQVTLSVVLAFTGLLFIRSLYEMATADVGFPTEHLMTARIDSSLLTIEERTVFNNSLISAATSVPGVQSTMLTANPPMDSGVGIYRVSDPVLGKDYGEMYFVPAPPGYFRFLGMKMLAGREYQDSLDDRTNSVVINRVLAEKLWPNESPLGKAIHLRHTNQGDATRHVIGVSPQDNCWNHLSGSEPCIYSQMPPTGPATGLATLVLRVGSFGGVETRLREAVRSLHPKVLIHTVEPLDKMLSEKISTTRVAAITTGLLAALGVLLSAIGCFAVFSSIVKENSREIAIRVALGVSARRLITTIILPAVAISMVGIGVGLGLAMFGSQYIQEQLYETKSNDGFTLAAIAVGVILIAVIASYVPARSAARTDPVSALKG